MQLRDHVGIIMMIILHTHSYMHTVKLVLCALLHIHHMHNTVHLSLSTVVLNSRDW